MKLADALRTLTGAEQRSGPSLRCGLAAGFNTLHLRTFLGAELSHIFADQRIEISDGLYGDLIGNIGRLSSEEFDYGFVLIEWPDLDPRLGIRNTARWTPGELADILDTTRSRALQIQKALDDACLRLTVAVSLPTLRLPPFACTPRWQANSFTLEMHSTVQSLACTVSHNPRLRVLSSEWLGLHSPLHERYDPQSELQSGFPYRLPHASQLASLLCRLVERNKPKKGLITDFDETLWKGILGEDGVDGISWNLDHGSQIYAFYQRFLGALASEGVLIAAATRNDPGMVEQAFTRSDLAVAPDAIFPVEANWQTKSRSVEQILKVWNIGADAVVFVDDNPREIAEVKLAFPALECVRFPAGNAVAICELIEQLRDWFGKSTVTEEDAIRLSSIRRSHLRTTAETKAGAEPAQEQLGAEIVCDFGTSLSDPRPLELVNKTNQFNLNGRRYTDAEWRRLVSAPASFLLTATYRDKFGPLGRVAVLAGSIDGRRLTIHTWVMSCRAFGRGIEYRCLAELLPRFAPQEIAFDYIHTERNSPIQEFLKDILGEMPVAGCIISRENLRLRSDAVTNLQEAVYG